MIFFRLAVLFVLAFLSSACGGASPTSVFDNLTDTPSASVSITHTPNTITLVRPRSTPGPSPFPTSTSLPPGPFKPVHSQWELPPDLISILYASDDGTVWLQTEHQIIILRVNNWEIALDDIPGEILGIDESGLIWTLNSDGRSISSWDGELWNTYSEESGWNAIGESSFIKDGPITDQFGQLWMVTSEDLRVFDGHRWTRFTPKDLGLSHPLELEEEVLPDMHLRNLKGSQELWLGSCNWTGAGPIGGQGVLRYDGRSWRGINVTTSSGCAEVIVEDREGRTWFGLDGDVWRYDPNTDTQIKFAAPPSPFEGSGFFAGVRAIVLDAENNPWADFLFCGGGGCGFGTILYHYENGEWIEIIQEDFHYHELVFDQSGAPWLLTPGGVFEIVDNQLELFLELPIDPNSVVKSRGGQVWFLVQFGDVRQLWSLNNIQSK
jgi:hypothetical protein